MNVLNEADIMYNFSQTMHHKYIQVVQIEETNYITQTKPIRSYFQNLEIILDSSLCTART